MRNVETGKFGAYKRRHFIVTDSIHETVDYAERHGCGDWRDNSASNASWSGAPSFEAAAKQAREGDMTIVPKADALIEKFEQFTLDSMGARAWSDDVVGVFPNVPAYIAGVPTNMRRRIKVESPAAPIALIVEQFVSGSVSHQKVFERGVACLALVRLLAMKRPVELYLSFTSHDYSGKLCSILTRVETTPLDLATAAHAIAAPSFLRRVLFSALRNLIGIRNQGPPARLEPSDMVKALAPALPDIGQVVYFPGLVTENGIGDAEKWVRDQVAKLATLDMEEAA